MARAAEQGSQQANRRLRTTHLPHRAGSVNTQAFSPAQAYDADRHRALPPGLPGQTVIERDGPADRRADAGHGDDPKLAADRADAIAHAVEDIAIADAGLRAVDPGRIIGDRESNALPIPSPRWPLRVPRALHA